MPQIKVNSITNRNNNGPVNLPNGALISSGGIIAGNISVSGILTATSFSGDGSQLTNLPGVTNSKVIALNKILSYNECFRS